VIRFNKLRLTGFKSFVEATELSIDTGLTGVVGPNGCGKSNLVEALRWVMGESSAKQMRGTAMDDVIFGGTTERPARNIAEVSLYLDNTERTAPAQFNDFVDLEVSRRIERESGSNYRVNGKEVRAKDVQLLFADSSTGARSTAMVSQGKIGAVIAAKPTQRRALLEEAAGITGLHSRRHEAELRLRGAETNLDRLEDILGTLDAQMQGLKKQARQAARYRNISDHIRKAEAALYHLRWLAATGDLENHRRELEETAAEVDRLSRVAAGCATNQGEAAAVLPELRQTEAAAAAELHRLTVARDGIEAEERRIAEAHSETERRLLQIAADMEREKALAADSKEAIGNLENEHGEIEAAHEQQEQRGNEAEALLAEANAAAHDLEAALSELTEQNATDEARRASLTRTLAELSERRQRLAGKAQDTEEQRARVEAEAIDPAVLLEAENAVETSRATLESARARAVRAGTVRAESTDNVSNLVTRQHTSEAALTRLVAEEQTLADVLKTGNGNGDNWPTLVDEVTVNTGFEFALGVALGEDLSAPADQPAPIRWRTLLPFANAARLPNGAEPLSQYVSGPAALQRRLSQIGVVYDDDEGERLSGSLQQGQCLVSRDGALWRWDGYTVSAGAETAAASRLQQRNRLAEIRGLLDDARADVSAAGEAVNRARQAAATAVEEERNAGGDATTADAAFNAARESLSAIKERATHQSSRLSALVDSAAAINTDIEETEARATESDTAMAALPDPEVARGKIIAMRAEMAERRTLQIERQSAFDSLVRAAEERRRRLLDIGRELVSWRQRIDGANSQIESLELRQRDETTELERLAALPAELMEKRRILMDGIETSEQTRKRAADALAEAEARLAEADKALRAAEAELATARENRIRSEGHVEQSEQACAAITEMVDDKLSATPDQLFEIAALNEDKELPELDATERRVERLHRERDTMGPVNLRAEQEMQELKEQIESLVTERDDLVEAIEKLRRGISELNREGRQRLLESFRQVDKHFQELFVRLFGGGKAYLQLTDSDDPLEAGLEIMASPPGKKLQVLSLLSGGEQALTALALLFGVFLTNPAPICVLDEVDAPLDDANVDRFCKMLKEMAESGRTRFLVITHHRMTMARMDRLFGVTMAERGVSQLVSVDLQQAERFRETG